MQLRTFLADDMRAALRDVRSAMGPDAVIVASQRAKGGGVIVRAALDEPDTGPESEPASAVPQESTGSADFELVFHNTLIRRLRDKNAQIPGRRPFDRAELLCAFARHRLPDALAHELAEAAANSGLSDMTLAVAAAIGARMRSTPVDLGTAKAILLMGSNGAGKTAVAAKLAAHAKLADREVLLIAGDVSGAGAVARLKDFADHLGVGILTAESACALANAVAAATEQGTLAIVDTAGFDPRNPKAAAAFAALSGIESVEAVGVVSALCDSEEMTEITLALAAAGASRLIVTAVDLARRMGALAAAAASDIGTSYVTRSPFVAGGLETLTPLALARLLMEEGGAQ
jgi:flagellar biosynthesis protein FlhF